MNAIITPAPLGGKMALPPSKSYSHRALICAHLGGGTLFGVGSSADIEATRQCLGALTHGETMDANESGSTLRFMIPIALALNGEVEIRGSVRLLERPLGEYERIFAAQGISFIKEEGCIKAHGRLKSGAFTLSGGVSSQFISGLLFALPLLKGDSEIIIDGAMESVGYLDMTIDVLHKFSVDVRRDGNTFFIAGNQSYKAASYTVEGDCSQSAFFLAMGADCANMPHKTLQGDFRIVELYRAMGMQVKETPQGFSSNGVATRPIEVDISQTPDLAPPLAAVMARTEGVSRITNASRLRIKESDRISAIAASLGALGAEIEEGNDYLIIKGKKALRGGSADAFNDHRIAMAAASVSPYCQGTVTVLGARCVDKSMPDFWDVFCALGGKLKWAL